jgi:hypothetical protein
MAKLFGVISYTRRLHLDPLAWSAAFAPAEVKCIQQRDDLGPFVTIPWGRARG